MSESPLLVVEDLCVSYGGAIAVDRVSINIREHEMLAIVGANGAGKTSLIRSIAGIVPASGGVVKWKGEDITGRRPWEICNVGIAQVAEGRQIFPSMTVHENLLVGGSLPRARKQQVAGFERVYELFPRLKERRSQHAGTLSGGEQQMLAIGRAIMAAPELLMLDEPSLGLSPLLTEIMFKIVATLHDLGTTILLVEQNVAQSLKLSSRAYVMENGAIAMEGAAHELMANDDVRKAYLGL